MIKQSEKGKISKIISTFAEKIGKARMVFEYDVLVIGGGHAGCEAASAAAKPECRRFIGRVVDDIVLRYDVDAIHR